MSEEELIAAFAAGQLPRRAFVRQLVQRGMPLDEALTFAERLVPEARPPAPAPEAAPNGRRRAAMAARPAQVDGLEIAPTRDGYTIVSPATDRVHSLNGAATLVFELCTGEHDSAGIARLLQSAFGLAAPPLDETARCLQSLFAEGLIA